MDISIAERPLPSFAGCREHAPPAGLVGTDLAPRFRHWAGASGSRYLFSVFALGDSADETPAFEDAVVLAVAHGPAGGRRVLLVEDTGPLPDLFFAGARFRAACDAGANELHVHLLAGDGRARGAVVRDLRG